MNAISDLYIKTEVEAALMELFGSVSNVKDVAARLIAALDDRDIDLVPR